MRHSKKTDTVKIKNLEIHIDEFKSKAAATDRYTSFDYCYNYFRNTSDLTKDIEKKLFGFGILFSKFGEC